MRDTQRHHEMTDNAPRCLYCGYNLTGLAEGARCPECGMVSVPEAFRREIWDTVDSRRRLWTLMARPIAKHPPGWWWSLDRPGDVRRSIVALIRNLFISFLVVLCALSAADSVVVQKTRVFEHYDQADPQRETLWWDRDVISYRMFNRYHRGEVTSGGSRPSWSGEQRVRMPALRSTISYRLLWEWSTIAPVYGAALFAWLFLVWASVAQVGLCTQIRKGLPSFAKPPRTIIAAANFQSCKLVFLAVLVALGCVTEVVARGVWHAQLSGGFDSGLGRLLPLSPLGLRGYDLALEGLVVGLLVAAGTIWVGALRSDFTRQLIRSRMHATRLILMYAMALPALTVFAVWVWVAVHMGTFP
ncbi:MAG: hypothetical protein V2A79_01420 [Planctomycetota bacterium]